QPFFGTLKAFVFERLPVGGGIPRRHRQPAEQAAGENRRQRSEPHRFPRPFFTLQSAFTSGLSRQPRLACPTKRARANCDSRHRFSALTKTPRFPDFSVSTNLLTGASGMVGKLP